MYMVPRAKKESFFDKKIVLPERITFFCKEYTEKISKLTECLISGIKTELSENALMDFIYNKELKREEYELCIKDGKIKIGYFDYLGIRNAVATLSNLIGADFSVQECEIKDYPDCAHRGFMLDIGRGVEALSKLKEDMILCARAKMNYMHFHFYDAVGSGVKLDNFPDSMCFSNAYTKEEVENLIEFCDILGLEIIPEFDIPAHAFCLVKAFPELRCKTEDGVGTDWVACAGEEKLYELYDRVITEVAELFPSKYLHIGGDEIEFRDKPELGRLCHWDECEKCKAYMEKNNIKDRQDLWYSVLLRVYNMVKKHNKTMIMWSDQLDCNREIPVPKDVIMQFWRVAGEGRGPFYNCSMNAQLKAGYKVINSHFPDTYVDMEQYVNSEKLKDWFWDESPVCDEELRENIIGSETCAWEYGNHARYHHYEYSLPSAIVLMGDKYWNKDVLPYCEKYEELVTRTVIGIKTPEGLNVFKCIGDIIPPRSDEKIYKEKITCSKDEIDKTVEILNSIENNIRAEAYSRCITEGMALNEKVEMIESLE